MPNDASIKPELSSIESALEDLARRVESLGLSQQRIPGAEGVGSDLLAVEAAMRTSQRRLAKVLDRLR